MNCRNIFSVFWLFSLLLLSSCGKSPLQMEKDENEFRGQRGLEVDKFVRTTGHQLDLVSLSPINTNAPGHFLLISTKGEVFNDLPEGFSVYLWMPSMGHGSSPVTIKKLGTGMYDLANVYFIMAGDWEIRIQLKSGTKILEEVNFFYLL